MRQIQLEDVLAYLIKMKPEQEILYRSHNQTRPIKSSNFTLEEKIAIGITIALFGVVIGVQNWVEKYNKSYIPTERHYTNSYEVRR